MAGPLVVYASLDNLHNKSLRFAPPPPDTYYEMLESRLPAHGEPLHEFSQRGISSTARPRAAIRAC